MHLQPHPLSTVRILSGSRVFIFIHTRTVAQCSRLKLFESFTPSPCAWSSVRSLHFDSPFRCDDSFWILAVSATSGRDARILVDSGTDAHVCPTSFATATFLAVAKGGMLYDAQRYKIEAHGTRIVCMKLVQSSESQT